MFIPATLKAITNLLNLVNFLVINFSKIQLSHSFVPFGIDIGHLTATSWRMGWSGESKIVSLSWLVPLWGRLKCWAQGGLSTLVPYMASTLWWPQSSWTSYILVQSSKSKCPSKQGRSHMAFYDLPSEVTLCHLHCILLIKAVTSLTRF